MLCILLHAGSFIHLFRPISIAPLQVRYYSEALPTQHRYCARVSSHRQLRVKDLPKVATWRLERDSNKRPSSWKAPTLPMLHHVPCWYI